MGVIYYLCPDEDAPAGGVRRLYHHVESLVQHGFAARILHKSAGFQLKWFSSTAPVCSIDGGTRPGLGDVLVIPELCHRIIQRTRDAPFERVVIALSWTYVFEGFSPGEDYRSLGIRHVISGSEYIRTFLLRTMGVDSVVISPGNDLDLFTPGADKKLQIACMPRKNPRDLHNIECIFRCRFPEHQDVSFLRINSSGHEMVARHLRESCIFLATGYPEGIARPPLEAMASGCVVVGFHGRGSLEYMRHGENCYLVDDGDVLSAAEYLGLAARAIKCGESGAMQAAARRTARDYSYDKEVRAVVSYWRRFAADSLAGRLSGHE